MACVSVVATRIGLVAVAVRWEKNLFDARWAQDE
jgi:hypothetical protein